jgi:uncharacterized membrane protein
MKQVRFENVPLDAKPFAGFAPILNRVLLVIFALCLVLTAASLLPAFHFSGAREWTNGLLLIVTAATALTSPARHLPGQNVALASIIILIASAIIVSIGSASSIPFGPFIFTADSGPQVFRGLPIAIPFVWLIAILTSRGTARLILRPWRKTKNYGFWLMGITALLVALFDFNLEPYATRVNHFWLWQPTKAGAGWYGAPWVNLFSWAMTALLILAFITPSLVNKKRVKQATDYSPLIIWVCLALLFATGSFQQQLWLAAISGLLLSAAVATFAIRGARW